MLAEKRNSDSDKQNEHATEDTRLRNTEDTACELTGVIE